MGREEVIKKALTEFLTKHSATDAISSVDEIVLSYIVGCLEDLGSQDAGEDAFDVDTFVEMMQAYIPGFADISSEKVCEWMFKLSDELKYEELDSNDTGKNVTMKMPEPEVVAVNNKPIQKQMNTKERTRSTNSTSSTGSTRSRSRSTNSISSEKNESPNGELSGEMGTACAQDESSEDTETEHQVGLLLEMFPTTCAIEVTHCLCVVNGDMERAAQLILHRQENGESISQKKAMQPHVPSSKKTAVVNEKKMRESILAKYSYVDMDDDKKEHRPEISRKFQQPKKLIRYLDNQVVSTKGERFTEIKKKEDEDVVKKTTVNIKPSKQYRFH